MNKRKAGAAGEQIAVEYLKEHGYAILKCNYFTRYGEIDIIATERDTLVFVEVKTRKDAAFGAAAQAVTFKKQETMKTVAGIYIQQECEKEMNARFDIIEVYTKDTVRINHITNAFF
ncbi:YraN family protein [Clostridia bacterium OttesenSCG-928-F22]|nr:YraN family protein [Clostridia bacterium OttesenSCG-928-F22]